MAEVAQRYQDQLKRLKKSVESSHVYFKQNYDRFHEFVNFVFNTSISEDDRTVLSQLNKPQIECNIQEAFISRLCGEFSKQQPSISVSGANGYQTDPNLINFLEGHFRWLLYQANNNSFEYKVYQDQLSGGFSNMKVWTEYEHERSNNQIIRIGKSYDPTLVGFDPLARESHKADGRYWFELYPKAEDEFIEEYPDVDISKIKFTRNVEGFNWSYVNNEEKVLLICEFYEKKKKKAKLLTLANNQTMLDSEYEKFVAQWNESIQKGLTIQQPPAIVSERQTTITTICRYCFIENKVIDYDETDYGYLNGVFVDGNSRYIRQGGGSGANIQMTRPYTYQAMGVQKLKNFAMQTHANELENLVQHKWMVPKEGIPPEFSDAYTDNQTPNVIIYNAYKDNDPDKPLPPPQAIARAPIPPEILQTFQVCDQSMQMVLGSFDASLGINDNQLSGIAIVEGATQSNSAAMPYIVSFLQALNQIAQIVIDLIPKYYKTPRTLPVMDVQGKRSWVKVNTAGGVNLNYDTSQLHVRVEAGVNFAVQKAKALQQIISLSQASQIFSQFINVDGLDILLDNLEIRGIDQLQSRAALFKTQMQKQQAQAAQMPNPVAMKMQVDQQKNAIQQQQNVLDAQFRAQEIQNDRDSIANDTLQIMLEAEQANRKDVVEFAKANAENERSRADVALATHDNLLKHHDQMHQQMMDKVNLAHEMNVTQQELNQKQSNQQPTSGEISNG